MSLADATGGRPKGWEVDWDHAEQAHTSTVRGWDRLPVVAR